MGRRAEARQRARMMAEAHKWFEDNPDYHVESIDLDKTYARMIPYHGETTLTPQGSGYIDVDGVEGAFLGAYQACKNHQEAGFLALITQATAEEKAATWLARCSDREWRYLSAKQKDAYRTAIKIVHNYLKDV